MTLRHHPDTWPLLDVDALYVNGWLDDCNTTLTEDTNMSTNMTVAEQSNYDRGRREARNLMVDKRFGLRAALTDLMVHLRTDVPAAYSAGYADTVLEAVQG